eukprot:12869345-Alexandrium_andersonii.AAC.1
MCIRDSPANVAPRRPLRPVRGAPHWQRRAAPSQGGSARPADRAAEPQAHSGSPWPVAPCQ